MRRSNLRTACHVSGQLVLLEEKCTNSELFGGRGPRVDVYYEYRKFVKLSSDHGRPCVGPLRCPRVVVGWRTRS